MIAVITGNFCSNKIKSFGNATSGFYFIEPEKAKEFIEIILKKADGYTFANPSMHFFIDFIKEKAGEKLLEGVKTA